MRAGESNVRFLTGSCRAGLRSVGKLGNGSPDVTFYRSCSRLNWLTLSFSLCVCISVLIVWRLLDFDLPDVSISAPLVRFEVPVYPLCDCTLSKSVENVLRELPIC